ncbi:vacuolar-type H+-ATPase subunit I/STV1 [Clostridium moniliforme]|uniref:Vacuolar-type H+-ATPase subunit I/STV1 n=1 Tax=Clostridium moniliforme TaxID=39489 RepID=A0ABS4F2W1_9CLOT|nr:bacteriocin immunity protein [Clostridium moniliforme]MBP1890591.1 vacuolar-type H+-ATPase subunit I/STV1 [Clostridium moniliforme]
MSKKEKILEKQDDLLSRVYDLILNTQTLDDERSKLVEFKNSVEMGKDFEQQTMELAESLRQLAVRKAKDKETLSPEVGRFYMDISTTGLLKKNLGIGLTAISFLAN